MLQLVSINHGCKAEEMNIKSKDPTDFSSTQRYTSGRTRDGRGQLHAKQVGHARVPRVPNEGLCRASTWLPWIPN